MKTLDKGSEKIKKICDALREETLEPAQQEAQQMLVQARNEAEKIIADAKQEAARMTKQARETMEQERHVFHSSLTQAAKQSLEALRQEIETKLFHPQLQELLANRLVEPQVIAKIIEGLIRGIEKEGISSELAAIIPKTVTTEQINQLLSQQVLDKIRQQSAVVGEFSAGAKIKMQGLNMCVEITPESVHELIWNYIRKDLRKLIFSE